MLRGKDFFLNAFKEGVPEEVEQVDDTPVVEVEPVVEAVAEVVTEPVVETIPTYEIDGEKITIDQIKEWKQNGLRQSDYTKKTQELAQQRKELEALGTEIPEREGSSELERLERIERELVTRQLDLEITEFKVKYPDFDEVAVLNEAEKRGIYDLEFVYKALRNDNSSSEQINIEELKTQAIEEYKAKIAVEKQKNKEATSDSIISSVPGQAVVDYGDELTSQEKEYCNKRGWTYKSYVDMKAKQY
jgi:hypothetical protein